MYKEETISNFKPTYLYIKIHNDTGLKYFGKTCSKNPKQYKGSGRRWKNHINKHGYNVTTIIYGFYDDVHECMEAALSFSIVNDIVNSSEWANLELEDGLWGSRNTPSKIIAQKCKETKEFKKLNLSEEEILAKKERNRLQGLKRRGISKGKGRKSNKRVLYEENPNYCEICGCVLSFEKRKSPTCSNKCGHIYQGKLMKERGGNQNQKDAVSEAWKGKKRGPQSEEHKRKVVENRPSIKGSKWLYNKETKEKIRVMPENIEYFIERGFEFGCSRGPRVKVEEAKELQRVLDNIKEKVNES